MRYGLLTERQIEVLQLRAKGLTQEEVAEQIKTTRTNVTILEQRARQKIEAAHETLKKVEEIEAPVHVLIKPGADLFKVPRLVLKAADYKNIHVRMCATEIIGAINAIARHKIKGRQIVAPFKVVVTANGYVSIVN